MSKFALELGAESFRIVGPDGEESELADYGDVATLEIGEEQYIAMVPGTDRDEWDNFEGVVFELVEEETEIREVEFEIVDEAEEPGETPAAGSGV